MVRFRNCVLKTAVSAQVRMGYIHFENVPCHLTCLIKLGSNLLRTKILALSTKCSKTGRTVERDTQCLYFLSVTRSADVTELLPFRNARLSSIS